MTKTRITFLEPYSFIHSFMNATSSFPIKFDSNYNDICIFNCNKSCMVTYISRNLFVNPSVSSIRKTRIFSSEEKEVLPSIH